MGLSASVPAPPLPELPRDLWPRELVAGRPVAAVELWAADSPVLPWAVVELSEDFVFQLIHATSAEELSELLPSFLIQFCDHPDLIPFVHIWTSRARLARAFRAGVSAHRVLQGLFDKQVCPPGFSVRVRNQVYVVARCRQFPGGFLHQRVEYGIYCDQLVVDGSLEEGSVSHAFPSLVEAEVFPRRCQFQRWPPELALNH